MRTNENNISKQIALLLLFAFLFNCEEKLPLRIEPIQVAEPILKLTADFKYNTLPYKNIASNGVLFKVGIKNIFDEVFDDKPYIDGNIKILLEPDIFVKQLDFHMEDNNHLTVDTQNVAWIDVNWDQKDRENIPIWDKKYLKTDRLNFKAVARIKFYRNIPYHNSDTLSFTVEYDKEKINTRDNNFLAVDIVNVIHKMVIVKDRVFYDIHIDPCWICGTEGTIYKSTIIISIRNGIGFLCFFTKQELNINENLNDILFVGNNRGWCIGDDGVILFTDDAGSSWQQKTEIIHENLNDIFFFSEKMGWIVGSNGIILKTTDEGNTWIQKNSNTQVSIKRVYFSTANYGVAVGELGTILVTNNGGDTWQVYRKYYTNCFTDVYFEGSSKEIIITGSEGFFKKFNLTHLNWIDCNLNLPTGINRFFFTNSNNGFGVGNKGAIYKIRKNIERTTAFRQPTISLNCIHDINFFDSKIGIAVGDGQTVLCSTSGDAWYCVRNYFGEADGRSPPGVPNYDINK